MWVGVLRFPVRRQHWQCFETQAWTDFSVVSRGALHAELDLPGGDTLQLSTIHTSSGTDVILEGIGLQDSWLFKDYNAEGLAQVTPHGPTPQCHVIGAA